VASVPAESMSTVILSSSDISAVVIDVVDFTKSPDKNSIAEPSIEVPFILISIPELVEPDVVKDALTFVTVKFLGAYKAIFDVPVVIAVVSSEAANTKS